MVLSRAIVVGALVYVVLVPSVGVADDIAIHVLTMGPDKFLVTRFGHTAIMVENRDTGRGIVYNFGEFDYSDPDTVKKFVTGRLQYHLDITTKKKLFRFYRRVGRGMTSQELLLSDGEKRIIVQRLRELSKPENRRYPYRYFDNNCCTKVRDLIDEVTRGALSGNRALAKQTYRHWLRQSLEPLPLAKVGLMFVLGPEADRPITRFEEQFFPLVLAQNLDTARHPVSHKPLIAGSERISQEIPARVVPGGRVLQASLLWGLPSIVLLGFVLAALFPGRRFALWLLGGFVMTWGIVVALGGSVLLFLWTMTEHTPAHANENLLLFPISHFVLAVIGAVLLIKKRMTRRMCRILVWTLVVSLGLALLDAVLKLGPFNQDNIDFIIVALLMNSAALWAVASNCRHITV